MSPTLSQTADPHESLVDAYRLAATALADMQRLRICPTAAAYELWLAYHAASNPALTGRVHQLVAAGQTITPATVQALREEFDFEGAGDRDPLERLLKTSDGLQDAAQALIQHAADGRFALRDYNEVLSQSVAEFGAEPGGTAAARVIGRLTSETLKMAERNRDLREQLAATSARVDKLRRALADEKHAANTDPLTGLCNRRAFDARFKRVLTRIATEPGTSAALLLLDIDFFKRFNDTYGHRTGDLVLRLVGRLLIESIKGRDLAARYGGEEFAVLLIGADLNAAANVGRQICATLADRRFKLSSGTEAGESRVTISIGVAQLRATDAEGSAIDRADAALYAAKHAGRNRVMTERDLVPA